MSGGGNKVYKVTKLTMHTITHKLLDLSHLSKGAVCYCIITTIAVVEIQVGLLADHVLVSSGLLLAIFWFSFLPRFILKLP